MKLIKRAQFGTTLQQEDDLVLQDNNPMQNLFPDFNEMGTAYLTKGQGGGGGGHWVDAAASDTMDIPYLWGGKWKGSDKKKKPKGIDCSGLVCHVARNYAGVNLGETNAQGIYNKLKGKYNNVIKANGQRRAFDQSKLRKGDIIYFGSKNGDGTNHVGIIHSIRGGKAYMLNASGTYHRVVVKPIDEYIDNHKFAAITRLR